MRALSILLVSLAAKATLAAPDPLLVTTTSGRVQGFQDPSTAAVPLHKWLGVRYAADTAGANRWRPPQPVRSAPQNVFNASAYGPACLQGRADGGAGTAVQSEDCLRINLIAPASATRALPVYLYIHGGGFDSGVSSDPKIDGSHLAARGVLFASVNYRLSLWGFPHSAVLREARDTQNLGLLDVRAAVLWLRANAAAFGGDPARIVLGGESVGAEMTNFYLHAWPNDSYIRGAIMQSGDTAQPMWQENSQLDLVAKNTSCPAPAGVAQLACLRRRSGDELRAALLATGAQFQPVTDNVTVFMDYVAQTRRGKTARVPMLVGTNRDEGTLIVEGEPMAYLENIDAYSKSNNLNFPWGDLAKLKAIYPVPSADFPSAYNASAAMWRDAHMLCLVHNLATERTRALRLPVWRYRFDLVADNLNSRGARIGAFHGSDIRFVMGQWRVIVTQPPYVPATPFQVGVSDLMVTAWTNFIKDPTAGPRIPGWRVYDPADVSTLAILGNSTAAALPGDAAAADVSCKYWNELLPTYPRTFPACGSWTC